MVKRLFLLVSVIYLATCPALGEELVISLHSTVSGNQEQPKVMYILPWQQSGHMQFKQDFNAQLAGDLFAPLDPEEFVRALNYSTIPGSAQNDSGDENTASTLNTQ